MKLHSTTRELLIVVVCLLAGFLISHFGLTKYRERVYNCDLAEISPDFPAKVKQQCREQRMGKHEDSNRQ